MSFETLWLRSELIQALKEIGYTQPTKIQADVLPVALTHKHILGQSNTGSWKTAAFVLPLLHHVDTKKWFPQVLIIAPTRELVNQIREEIFTLSKYMKVRSLAVYGGMSMRYQKEQLQKWPQIIIATPGRLLQFINEKVLDTKKISYFVLDEVDRMLDMWFIDDIQTIRGSLKNLKQTYLFSATISSEITDIIKKHLHEYEHIKVHEEVTVSTIDHSFMYVQPSEKISTLEHILLQHTDQKIIIFTQTKKNTDILAKFLIDKWVKATPLHGWMDQRTRNIVLKQYKNKEIDILVTTDVAARWLNLHNIDLVINFDVPQDSESYIHRIWRTGRAGASGEAIMFVTPDEKQFLTAIEKKHTGRIKFAKYTSMPDQKNEFTWLDLDIYRGSDKKSKKRWVSSHNTRKWYKKNTSKGNMSQEYVSKRYAGDDYSSYGSDPDDYAKKAVSDKKTDNKNYDYEWVSV